MLNLRNQRDLEQLEVRWAGGKSGCRGFVGVFCQVFRIGDGRLTPYSGSFFWSKGVSG
jgi:hypothetical protein